MQLTERELKWLPRRRSPSSAILAGHCLTDRWRRRRCSRDKRPSSRMSGVSNLRIGRDSQVRRLGWTGLIVLLAYLLILSPGLGDDRGLGASLAADKAVYGPGEAIRLTFEVVNEGESPLRLEFTSMQRFDFAIEDASGTELWRWSDGRAFGQALGEEVLGSERPMLSYDAIVEGAFPAGNYRVRAWLTDTSGRFAATIGIAVN